MEISRMVVADAFKTAKEKILKTRSVQALPERLNAERLRRYWLERAESPRPSDLLPKLLELRARIRDGLDETIRAFEDAQQIVAGLENELRRVSSELEAAYQIAIDADSSAAMADAALELEDQLERQVVAEASRATETTVRPAAG